MILQQKKDFAFHGRNKRPPLDSVNALLSFVYTLLTNTITSALETVGLDPYVGYLHTDRPGRASLSLDLIEELRAVLVDRFVLSLINKKMVSGKNFSKKELEVAKRRGLSALAVLHFHRSSILLNRLSYI